MSSMLLTPCWGQRLPRPTGQQEPYSWNMEFNVKDRELFFPSKNQISSKDKRSSSPFLSFCTWSELPKSPLLGKSS